MDHEDYLLFIKCIFHADIASGSATLCSACCTKLQVLACCQAGITGIRVQVSGTPH